LYINQYFQVIIFLFDDCLYFCRYHALYCLLFLFMLEYDCRHNIHMYITLVFIFLQWFSKGTSIQSKYFSFYTPSFNSLGATQLLHIWVFGPLRNSPLVKISLIIPKKLNFLHFSPVNSTPFRSTLGWRSFHVHGAWQPTMPSVVDMVWS
jgi:hypothetical protein